MSTLEKIRVEIAKLTCDCINGMVNQYAVLQIIDKYAEQEPCENCCNGNQIEKAKLCQKSYLAGMEHKKEPCDDAVSRQAVLEIAKSHTLTDDYWALQNLPSVRPQEKTGHWIKGKCDQCGGHAPFWSMASTYYESEYCPNCGAKMESEV